ncbi:MAG: insulinase family protein, partial [Alphaproteobacteria bacterium]|nr:insulinase family protein [Alphaproteobacteria bacterium]
MPGLATVAVGVWVRVGARWERANENGIAHLFEHMAFKGAAGRDA